MQNELPARTYTAADLPQGARVRTPLGAGRVAYVRLRPPDFREVDAVSVVLDSRRHDLSYAGTIFAADGIRKDDQEDSCLTGNYGRRRA